METVPAPPGLPSNRSGALKSVGGARTEAMRAASASVRGVGERWRSCKPETSAKAGVARIITKAGSDCRMAGPSLEKGWHRTCHPSFVRFVPFDHRQGQRVQSVHLGRLLENGVRVVEAVRALNRDFVQFKRGNRTFDRLCLCDQCVNRRHDQRFATFVATRQHLVI